MALLILIHFCNRSSGSGIKLQYITHISISSLIRVWQLTLMMI